MLSKPEDGTGEPSYKPVVETFVHKDKEIWMVKAEKYLCSFDKDDNMIDHQAYEDSWESPEFLSTPNHPVWVVGMADRPELKVKFYDEPHWKRVDELSKDEVVVNNQGVMYTIERAQPLYQFSADGVDAKPTCHHHCKIDPLTPS